MDTTFYHKQAKDKPLFPDLLWSRPENRQHAGKLLIIGGNLHGFGAPGEAYNQAVKAGVGTAKVLLPNALQRTVGGILENGEFAASNKSGSFAKNALPEWQEWAAWSDGVLIAGDLGRNSETAIVLESFLEKYSGPVCITKDALEYFSHQPAKLLDRPQTTVVGSLAQLQKLCAQAGWPKPIRFSMTLLQLADFLHELTEKYPCNIVVEHSGIIIVASGGDVSTTKLGVEPDSWRVAAAAHASVWWLQNPQKPFAAISCSVLDLL